jgi:stage III sporulation protein AG
MNYLETIKNITKNKEKRVENLVFLVVLLVIFLIALKYIFTSDKDEFDLSNNTSQSSNINSNGNSKTEASQESNGDTLNSNLESKLSTILSNISGISEVSVVFTYSQDSTSNPVYNTKEQEKAGEKTTEKSVAYNEKSGVKTAIIQSVEMPKIEGAIVVAKGADTVEMRSKIATAIATVTNIAVYKVQVFEKQG